MSETAEPVVLVTALCSRCMEPKLLEIRIVGPLALAWCADCWAGCRYTRNERRMT